MSPKQSSSDVPGAARARRRWRVAAADGHGPRRVATASGPDPSRAGQRVSGFQRTRLLNAALGLTSAGGWEAATVTAVVTEAGVSRKTFYDLFTDREDCLMALLDEFFSWIAAVLAPVWEAQGSFTERLRGALVAALGFLDSDRAAGALVIAYLVGRGPRRPELRARVLEHLHEAVDEGRLQATARSELSPLTAEVVVGGVLAVLDARLHEPSRDLFALANPLLWMIVLPYLGPGAARRELRRVVPTCPEMSAPPADDPLGGLNMRITYRTGRVLEVIAQSPGASNAAVATEAGITDPGQISRLLARLAGFGLIENVGPWQSAGGPKAWCLTGDGERLEAALTRKSVAGRR
jgi:AcrR family transcriptional regulator